MQHQVDITRQACTRGTPEACGQGEICIFNEIKHVKLLGLDLLSIYYQGDFFHFVYWMWIRYRILPNCIYYTGLHTFY